MKYKFVTPIRVGDLANSILVDEMEIESLALTFDPQRPIMSIVLIHKPTGWTHNIVYSDASAVEFWARTYEAEFDLLHKVWLSKLIADGKLPEGNIT